VSIRETAEQIALENSDGEFSEMSSAIEAALLAERERMRHQVVVFLRNHARFAGFAEAFGGYSAKEALEKKATQIENDNMKLCFNQTYEESEAIDAKAASSLEQKK